MRNLVILFVHVMATLARLLRPGGIRSVVADSVLVKQQLLILNRSRHRSPNLLTSAGISIIDFGPTDNISLAAPECNRQPGFQGWVLSARTEWASVTTSGR
jgi:hypothetical protein